MSNIAISKYRTMWVFVLFDLPTETRKERIEYSDFRKRLINDGFTMFQYSIYIRHCSSRENADVHLKRIEKIIPSSGKICIFCMTDHQFSQMRIYYKQGKTEPIDIPKQLELF